MSGLPDSVPIASVGGGQTGLSMSWHLTERGLEHVVLERSRAFCAWQDERWEAFTLVTPNFQCRLPDHPYDGDEPEGFMVKQEILDYLDGFPQALDPPLDEGVAVKRLDAAPSGGLELETTAGRCAPTRSSWRSAGYHTPWAPPAAHGLGRRALPRRDRLPGPPPRHTGPLRPRPAVAAHVGLGALRERRGAPGGGDGGGDPG